VDEKNDQIALRRIVAALEIHRNVERNSNAPETDEKKPVREQIGDQDRQRIQ
jgi:hypothetical protein